MELASFSLIPGETMLSVRARAMGNIESGGIATTYEVTGRRVQLTVADIAWDTGQRDVRVVDIATGVGKLGRLLRGGRIGVYEANFESFPVDVAWFELSVMTLNRDKRKLPTARKVDYPTAVKAAGDFHIWEALTVAGASSIGPRSELLGDEGTRRNYLAVTFPSGNKLVPTVAYVLTRIVPLSRGFAG